MLISCWGVTVKTGLLVGQQTQNTQTHRQEAAMTIKHWGGRKGGKNGFFYSRWGRNMTFEGSFGSCLNLLMRSSPFICRWVSYRKCSLIPVRFCPGNAAADAPWAMTSADRCGAIHHFSRFTRDSRAEIGSPFAPVKWELEPLGFIYVGSQCTEISSKTLSIWDIWDSAESLAVTTTP